MADKFLFLFLSFCFISVSKAQPSLPVFKGAIAAERQSFYEKAVKNSILSNLAKPLSAESEEDWATAFDIINVLQYRSVATDAKIDSAARHFSGWGTNYLVSLLDLLNNNYPAYSRQVFALLRSTRSPRVFRSAYGYIQQHGDAAQKAALMQHLKNMLRFDPTDKVYNSLRYYWIMDGYKPYDYSPHLSLFFNKNYLPGQVLVLSLQRPDRNYPGLAIVRDTSGNIVMANDSTVFSVGQLARSISNMPGVVSNGNTPVGVLRMDGFDVSRSYYIGPTTNVQLTLPHELKASQFFGDTTLNDTLWQHAKYLALFPAGLPYTRKIDEAWYAGKAGRSEIIAHGTTIDPEFYKGRPYYPFTPTAGCLATEEWWSPETGTLIESGQLQLNSAIQKAGGPHGYYFVLELADEKKPVTLADIQPYIPGR